jgi:hypothetical protein
MRYVTRLTVCFLSWWSGYQFLTPSAGVQMNPIANLNTGWVSAAWPTEPDRNHFCWRLTSPPLVRT